MMNMKLLAVVTKLSIYHSCYTWKMFWEEKLFLAVKMKNCGRRNVRKHREIKGSDKYVTLDISLNFDSLDKMKITSSYSKENWNDQESGWLPLWVSRPKWGQTNAKRQGMPSEMPVRRTFQRLLRSLKKLSYESYEKKRPKHEPTDSYFYPAIQLAKCMMRADALNLHG